MNRTWIGRYENATLHHLNPLKSDHCPILLKLGDGWSRQVWKETNFFFQSAWLTHETFSKLVEDTWKMGMDWSEAVNSFTSAAKVWNYNVFGNIFRKKERILKRLEGIDRAIERGSNRDFQPLQRDLWLEYEDFLLQEEMYWHQRARCDWLALGDKNTHFFHMATKMKKKRRNIEMLKDD